MFQSHAGSIEAGAVALAFTHKIQYRFNPTLVRLRLFQPPAPGSAPSGGFNPTLVRLRLSAWRLAPKGRVRFNPTLVRLRPKPGSWRSPAGRRFQSHAGSIEAASAKRGALASPRVSIPRWFD